MKTLTADFPRAVQLFNAGRLEEAEAECRALLVGYPHEPAVLRLLGVIARHSGRLEESLDLLEMALERQPEDAVLWFERGTSLREAARLNDALEHYLHATELQPDFGEAQVNVGGMLDQLERYSEALPWARRGTQLRPQCTIAWYNLGKIRQGLADIPAAIDCYQRSIACDPGHAKPHWNLAICRLLLGDFAGGWDEYEWRAATGEVQLDRYRQPRWDGTSLRNKTLLVHAEQGIGDEILFASCYPQLTDEARHCIFVCEPRLEALLRRSFPDATVYGYQRRNDWSPFEPPQTFDVQIAAGSLPKFLRRSLDSFPRQQQFLLANPQSVAQWRIRLAELGSGLKVGISWRAGGKPAESRKRSTQLETWRELLRTPGVQWINVQYGDAGDELKSVRETSGVQIHDWDDADPLVDLDAFAAKLSALDLVISVGNATVHLAGALGVPTWALLPQTPGWRWMIRGDSIPWYSSVRLFRQPSTGDWQPVFASIQAQLTSMLGRPQHRQEDLPTARNKASGPKSSVLQSCDHQLDDAIAKIMAEAISHHQSGRLHDAESIYREVLQHAPRHADALHLLGLVARETGRMELAISSIRRAVAVIDAAPLPHFNLGNAYKDSGRFDEAIASYRRAIELDPNFAAAHLNLGAAWQALGRQEPAAEAFRAALAVKPDYAEAHLNLGISLRDTYQTDEAIRCFRRAVELAPNFAAAHSALAGVLLADGELDEALGHCRLALAADPQSVAAHHNQGSTLQALGRSRDAIASYRQALELAPRQPESLGNLADLLHAEGELDEAARTYESLLTVCPSDARAMNQLGMVFQEQGRLDAALEQYERAIAAQPDFALAHSNRALVWLQQGDFARGWDEYEWRWQGGEGGLRPRTWFKQPKWNGESLADRSILVHGEQGVGDEIMFATCFPDVIAGAGRCELLCDRRLAGLFARSFPTATVHGVSRGHENAWQPAPGFQVDYQIAAGGLPRFLRRELSRFPRQRKLLIADAERAACWRDRLSALGPGMKIGVSWRGGKKRQDARLRWTSLAAWQPLLTTRGTHFVNLQYGDCGEEIAEFESRSNVRLQGWHDLDPLGDLDDLAAQISALDLVISVGNANVHLAGALGVPTWALLPCHSGWRWLQDREDSPWYASVKVFRQASLHGWRELFARVQSELFKLAC